ncbi:MAG: FkbM family methyltransferase, partial [Bacteroidota bacterium]
MENDLAPIVLFVYNRPQHTRRLLESLRANPLSRKSILYVFADGPRPTATAKEQEQIQAVRNLLQAVNWVKEIHIHESLDNLGLYKNVLYGIDQVLREYPKVIVLEDDLELSPSFLAYMNQALVFYQDQSQVMHINAFLPPMKKVPSEAFFSGLALVWGWATWDRAWKVFRADAKPLIEDIKREKRWGYFD